jgi:hypothetical protein
MSRPGAGAIRPDADPPTAGGAPAGDGRRRTDLPGTPGAVAIGREFTRRALADWGWIPDPPDLSRQTVAADILLLVSELLANAIMHAGGALELVVHPGRATGALRLEVIDADPTLPVPPAVHRPGHPGGHGLLIVEKLSDRWGVIPGLVGKTVWAEVDLSRLEDDLTT